MSTIVFHFPSSFLSSSIWLIFYPDRMPSTGARIVAHAYRPMRVRHLGGDFFMVHNATSFTSGEAFALRFEWSDGGVAELVCDVAPLRQQSVMVRPTSTVPCSAGEGLCRNRVRWVTVITRRLATGEEVAREQIQLAEMTPLGAGPLERRDEFAPGCAITDEGLVLLGIMRPAATPVLLSRAETDNDRFLSGERPMERLRACTREMVSVERQPGVVAVTSRLTFPHHRFLVTDTYEAVAAGVLVTSRLHCERGRGDLPRFGACYRLDASWDDVEYLGRNGESYRDMCAQTQIERVTCRVEDMTEPNIRPQESGNRMDCQYVTLSNGEKNVQFTAVDRPFELAVKPYSDDELREMRHREDEVRTGTYLTVQAFQMGIGTGSCGPATRPEYRFDCRQDYELRYLVSWE